MESDRMARREVARMIDHTLLAGDATTKGVVALCAQGHTEGFANVCVNPGWVALATSELAGSLTGVCTVVDFPLGSGGLELKCEATRIAIAEGADEVDMVMAVGRFKQGDDDTVTREIEGVLEAAAGKPVKVILETAFLREDEIVRACGLARKSGAAWVKTSTGFGPAGATIEAVRCMRASVGEAMGVKAAGGIGDVATALAMLDAGATRLGTSRSLAILQGLPG